MTQLSKHFTLHEFVRSATADAQGIDNTPPAIVVANLSNLVLNVIQPARDALQRPIFINSGYRCPKLNTEVGGVNSSHHKRGWACDACLTPLEENIILYNWIKDNCSYDQLIGEEGDGVDCEFEGVVHFFFSFIQ